MVKGLSSLIAELPFHIYIKLVTVIFHNVKLFIIVPGQTCVSSTKTDAQLHMS